MVLLAPIFKFNKEPASHQVLRLFYYDDSRLQIFDDYHSIQRGVKYCDAISVSNLLPAALCNILFSQPIGHGNFTGSLDKIKSNIFWLIRRGMGNTMLASSSMSFVVLTLSKFITKWAKKVSYQFKIPKSKRTIITWFWCESFDLIDYITHSTSFFLRVDI